ncbi:MAG: AMP phosphotransferase [Alphaproteobacteria bacterium]|nr:AMP phosphotransferase [Alphaproteobacteria bacterium]
MNKGDYDTKLAEVQRQLMLVQTTYSSVGARGVVVLEGWDAAGKGGLIRRMAWSMDPRTLRVYPISAPDAHETHEHWLQRFWRRLPRHGEIAVFDRSWYGRVLVERVEGYATDDAWKRAYREIKEFEQQLLLEDFRLVKLFLDISPETQLERFKRRFERPEKRWKLTAEDVRNRAKWAEYETAYADMLAKTQQARARWHKIDANDKRTARLTSTKKILKGLSRGMELRYPDPAPEAVAFLTDFSHNGGQH